MAKRLVRKFTDVVKEVEAYIISQDLATKAQLAGFQTRAKSLNLSFPSSTLVDISQLWIDYEVQRDVIYKHVLDIMKKWDPRICSPGSACRVDGEIYLYDAQHRTLAAALLGFTQIPCAIVDTDDKNFASYAFEILNSTGVKKLTPGDLHRNSLVRYKNNIRTPKVMQARVMQDQFDQAGIDLQDKNSRNNPNLRGNFDYFFSHFKYAQKATELDPKKGTVLKNILDAIKTTFPTQDEIDQGVFIGLYELQRLAGTNSNSALPKGWMKKVLTTVKQSFTDSHVVHTKAKTQWEHSHPGAGWNAPLAMSNFIREVYIRNGGTINLPYHGEGSTAGIIENNIAPGIFPVPFVLQEAA